MTDQFALDLQAERRARDHPRTHRAVRINSLDPQAENPGRAEGMRDQQRELRADRPAERTRPPCRWPAPVGARTRRTCRRHPWWSRVTTAAYYDQRRRVIMAPIKMQALIKVDWKPSSPFLSPYKLDHVALTRAKIVAGHRRILRFPPTVSGKTVIAAEIIRQNLARGNRDLFIAHRPELIDHAHHKLYDLRIDAGIILAGHPAQLSELVQVASITRRSHDVCAPMCAGSRTSWKPLMPLSTRPSTRMRPGVKPAA